jgi:hypothetical protein
VARNLIYECLGAKGCACSGQFAAGSRGLRSRESGTGCLRGTLVAAVVEEHESSRSTGAQEHRSTRSGRHRSPQERPVVAKVEEASNGYG